ncbi:MAG: fluoride efflux transporter CrcB [Bryobacteraceae bacterium]
MERYLCVLIGGGAGAVLRYMVGSAVASRYSGRFPLGTFLINVSGSFLIGLLMGLFTERYATHPNWRLFLVTGVLGGFTTFSSFEYEALVAAQTGAVATGMVYVVASVGIGFTAAWIGASLIARR